MAQNIWLNATSDPAASKKVDNTDHVHAVSGGTAAAGDLTISYDSAKVTSASIFDSLVSQIRRRAMGGGLK